MGWAPRTLNVTLPDKLSKLSGGRQYRNLPLFRWRSNRAHPDGAFGAGDGAHGKSR